jgi:hypothetical protein
MSNPNVVIIHGNGGLTANDPFIPIDEPRYIRDQLGTDYTEIPRAHFQDIVFSEVVESIKRKLNI